MKTVFRLVWVAALVALGVWLWTVFFPSPEQAVRKQLTKLAGDVSFSRDENSLVRIADAESVSGFFSTNVEVTINVPGQEEHTLSGRAEITQVALAARTQAGELKVKLPDVNVAVAPGGQSATADVTVEADVGGERDPIVQEMKFTFQKIDGQWLITRVETIRTLS
jgi:cytoskeletal protein RodZ